MKRLTFATVTAIALLCPPADAGESCGNSFWILPNGQCLNLDYLGTLGRTRSGLANYANAVNQLETANRTLDGFAATGQYKESDDKAIARQANLDAAKSDLAQERTDAQRVEDLAYPLHRQAMGAVCVAYGHCR